MDENQNQPRIRIKLLPTVFLIVQAVFLILFGISISKALKTDEVIDDPDHGKTAKISNISDAIPEKYDRWSRMVEWVLFSAILQNSEGGNVADEAISASIREGTLITKYFEKSSMNYLRAIIDVPELAQSYEVFLEYPNNNNAVEAVEYNEPNVAKPYSVLCIEKESDIIYKDFKCRSPSGSATRQEIALKTLEYFSFKYFSAYASPDIPNTIIISPTITYDNDEATKSRYIEEVKAAIESLGISSNLFNYHVRTAADVNYDNSE